MTQTPPSHSESYSADSTPKTAAKEEFVSDQGGREMQRSSGDHRSPKQRNRTPFTTSLFGFWRRPAKPRQNAVIRYMNEFLQASARGDAQTVVRVASLGLFDINLTEPTHQNTALHISCAMGRIDVIEALFSFPDIDIEKMNKHGKTAENVIRDWDTMQRFLELKKQRNRDTKKRTPIHAQNGSSGDPSPRENTPRDSASASQQVEEVSTVHPRTAEPKTNAEEENSHDTQYLKEQSIELERRYLEEKKRRIKLEEQLGQMRRRIQQDTIQREDHLQELHTLREEVERYRILISAMDEQKQRRQEVQRTKMTRLGFVLRCIGMIFTLLLFPCLWTMGRRKKSTLREPISSSVHRNSPLWALMLRKYLWL